MDHEGHMTAYLKTVFLSKKSSVLSEEKYELIMKYLRDPTSCDVDAHFRLLSYTNIIYYK